MYDILLFIAQTPVYMNTNNCKQTFRVTSFFMLLFGILFPNTCAKSPQTFIVNEYAKRNLRKTSTYSWLYRVKTLKKNHEITINFFFIYIVILTKCWSIFNIAKTPFKTTYKPLRLNICYFEKNYQKHKKCIFNVQRNVLI